MEYGCYIDKFMDVVKRCVLKTQTKEFKNYEEILNRLIKVFSDQSTNIGKKTFFIGNGGSAAISVHMTADFLKNGGLTTISMYDPAILTCLGNDYGYEYIFSKQIEIQAHQGDLLVAISSSGNSKNIIRAIDSAHEKGAHVLTLTGFEENNKAFQKGDYNFYVPSMEYGIVESVHNMILQQIVDYI